MKPADLCLRALSRYQRTVAAAFVRRPVEMRVTVPLISFSFDDFPKSAFWTGGAILKRYGLLGTYYASLGLMGTSAPTGRIFCAEDLKPLLKQGHELGCHTFGHCDAWETRPRDFEESIIENRVALRKLLPGIEFKTLSYPILCPRPSTKRRVAKHFICCRGGGQTFNRGTTDLNYVRGYFIEKSRGNFGLIQEIIHNNREARGWLVFATHDVSQEPTPYGCTPEYFEKIVRSSLDSGARIMPVAQACQAIRGGDGA